MTKQENRNIPAISVIVPIYNMEKLMRKCLDSILAQTFTDYECLLIDDGSTDGSLAICDEYAAKDSRFKAFHKPNGGLSDARNYGLAHAQGDYTIFFDPDDWVDEDCLKDMYAKAQETDADMVMCDLYYNDPYQQSYCKQEPSGLHHNDVLQDLITGKVFGFTVTKLIRQSLYQQYDLQYPKGMYGCEDQYTMCALLKNDIKIAYLPNAYYHYMHYGNETQSRKFDQDTYQMNVRTLCMFDELLKGTPVHQKAVDGKKYEIIASAFYYGRKYFTSSSFRDIFASYVSFIKGYHMPRYKKNLMILACKGFYRPANWCYQTLFKTKQIYKKIKYGILKKFLR